MRVSEMDLRLTVTDSPVGDMPEKIECPSHLDDAASLAVYRDHIHCYGCDLHSSGFYALAYLLYGERDDAAIRRAKGVAPRYTARSLDAYRERVDQQVTVDPLSRGLANAYHHMLFSPSREGRREWFRQRGLHDITLIRFGIGHDGTRFTLPVYSAHGDLLTFRYRRDDHYGVSYFDPKTGKEVAIPKYSGMRGRNGLWLYPANRLADEEPEELVVVEGELDAMRLWQEGVPAVSATNGAGAIAKLPGKIKAEFPSVRRLLFACDADEPGQAAQAQGLAGAEGLGFETGSLTWPLEWGKDITEVLQSHSWDEVIDGCNPE